MATLITEPGDHTSKPVVPDFEGAKAHHWMHMRREAERAGTLHLLPRKPRKGLAERSFFDQVDRRMSRRSFSVGVSFVNGRIVRSDEDEVA